MTSPDGYLLAAALAVPALDHQHPLYHRQLPPDLDQEGLHLVGHTPDRSDLTAREEQAAEAAPEAMAASKVVRMACPSQARRYFVTFPFNFLIAVLTGMPTSALSQKSQTDFAHASSLNLGTIPA